MFSALPILLMGSARWTSADDRSNREAPMPRKLNWWSRKLHRWGALASTLPLLVVIVSGLLLQVKKQVPWVQPPTQRGAASNEHPVQAWEDILAIARGVPEAEVGSWEDVDRLDVRPSRGIVKVRCRNRWELQIDLASGAVLSSTMRRSDLIESLHDGSFFSEPVKLGVFLPSGIILLVLWLTGAWLWYLPFRNRRVSRLRRDAGAEPRGDSPRAGAPD